MSICDPVYDSRTPGTTVDKRWTNVCDAGPALKQHWDNFSIITTPWWSIQRQIKVWLSICDAEINIKTTLGQRLPIDGDTYYQQKWAVDTTSVQCWNNSTGKTAETKVNHNWAEVSCLPWHTSALHSHHPANTSRLNQRWFDGGSSLRRWTNNKPVFRVFWAYHPTVAPPPPPIRPQPNDKINAGIRHTVDDWSANKKRWLKVSWKVGQRFQDRAFIGINKGRSIRHPACQPDNKERAAPFARPPAWLPACLPARL